MAGVTSKQELRPVNGTPRKRLFLSIISDYDLQTGLCELVDNALDLWLTNDKKPKPLKIDVTLNAQRQLIVVHDNAGGVKQVDLELLVAPGASRSDTSHDLIGIFGVGGKRAGVALGEHVEIRTHARGDVSVQLDITNEWLGSEDWDLTAYQVPDLPVGTTSVDISKLRQTFTEADVEDIRRHLGETYAWFINEGCELRLNKTLVTPVDFDGWAYPPAYLPRTATYTIFPADDRAITVTMTAGLILDRDPEGENYGVYVYCNHRLIAKALRIRDVGYFVRGEAGVPHPDASLCRVVIELQGPADLMPWNSSKSGLNFSHPAFTTIRLRLIGMVTYFSSLSRRLKTDWDGQVFSYPEGEKETIDPEEILSDRKIVLPKLPRVRKLPRFEIIKDLNKRILAKMPWTVGLIDAFGLVDIISKQKIETRNRASLVLLDSNFEIALKEFIVSRDDLFPPKKYPDSRIADLFKSRPTVIKEVSAHVAFPPDLISKVNHYYTLRNKLIHERATVGITDAQVLDYRKTVEKVLKLLFKLRFPTD